MDDYTLRSIDTDGTINEIELTPEQAMDTMQGRGFAYFPRDERMHIDVEGTITCRESAIPQQPDKAA